MTHLSKRSCDLKQNSTQEKTLEKGYGLSNAVPENDVFYGVPFCLRSLGRFARCASLSRQSVESNVKSYYFQNLSCQTIGEIDSVKLNVETFEFFHVVAT